MAVEEWPTGQADAAGENARADAVTGQSEPRRAALERVLAAATFARSPSLSRLLRYVCTEALEGRTAHLHEQIVGVEVFGRAPGYDSDADNIVRASASRLRQKLAAHFAGEGADEAWVITVPRGSYVPVFTERGGAKALEEAGSGAFGEGVIERDEASGVEREMRDVPLEGGSGDTEGGLAGTMLQERRRVLGGLVWLSGLVVVGAALFGLGAWWSVRAKREAGSGAIAVRHVPDKRAQELTAEGQYLWAKREPEPIRQAVTKFEEAIRIDPEYGAPYAGLAEAYAVTASGLPTEDREAKAKGYAEKALALDPGSSQAHAVLGFLLYKFEWNWPEAEQHFRQAVALDPNDALAHHWFGEFLVLRRRPAEGVAELRRSVALNPLSLAARNDLARALERTRQYDAAIGEAEHVLELDPGYDAYPVLTYAYEQKGDRARAVAADLKAAQLGGMSAEPREALRATYRRTGWTAYWAERLRLMRQAPAGSVPAYVLAEAALRAGEKDAALRYLTQSFEDRGDAPLLIGTEPLFDPLRADPRFQFLLERAGLA
jgi:tetratricopeptide (TPR) repeat protein